MKMYNLLHLPTGKLVGIGTHPDDFFSCRPSNSYIRQDHDIHIAYYHSGFSEEHNYVWGHNWDQESAEPSKFLCWECAKHLIRCGIYLVSDSKQTELLEEEFELIEIEK